MDPGAPDDAGARTTMIDTGSHDPAIPAELKAANRRTALALLSIALVFFVGVIAMHFVADATTGIAVIGTAVLLFLVVAIGRNLRAGSAGAKTGGRNAVGSARADPEPRR
jgi:hypothetical protein